MKKQRIRKDVKVAKLFVWFIILFVSILSIIYSFLGGKFRKQNIILNNYTSDFNYRYKVNNKDNEYVDYSYDKNYTAYVTDLIKNVDIEYNYSFSSNAKKPEKMKYKYEIIRKTMWILFKRWWRAKNNRKRLYYTK